MMNIREYFQNLYNATTSEIEWNAVAEYEQSVYDMEEGFEDWATAHNIDLSAMGAHEITILQYWAWDFED